MASPFENLLQASQFAIQTRMGYDQMIERKNENVSGLMQRRAEQQQQNQQFISEMNQKDKEFIARERQFNAQIELAKKTAEYQNYIAKENLNLTRSGQLASATYNQGMLDLAKTGQALAYRQDDRERDKYERTIKKLEEDEKILRAGPIKIYTDPGSNITGGYEDLSSVASFFRGLKPSPQTGNLPSIYGGFANIGREAKVSASNVAQSALQISNQVITGINESISSRRPVDQSSLLEAYFVIEKALNTAGNNMSERDKLLLEYTKRKMTPYLSTEAVERLKAQK